MTTAVNNPNVDDKEIEHFNSFAKAWWDESGQFGLLHRMNPLRLQFIDDRAFLHEKRVLDIGCGGGILTESMAKFGAEVTGIDQSDKLLAVAKQHVKESQLDIEYLKITAEELAEEVKNGKREPYDVVTCLEMLEHVPYPDKIIQACSQLVKPGGHLFFSTINRTAKAYMLAIVGAEYILGLLPKSTHEFKKFVKPSELALWCREVSIEVKEVTGMHYNPLTKHFKVAPGVDVNYLVHTIKENKG